MTVASSSTPPSPALRRPTVCDARKKGGPGNCGRPPGWGTTHLGWGRCKLHGGASPSGIKAALKQQIDYETEQMRVAIMGTALDVDPMDALLWCVRITAGEVAFSTSKVHALEEEDVIVNPTTETSREGGGAAVANHEVTEHQDELNLWIQVRQQCVDRLAKFSKMALDAGVAERQVKMAEGAGEELAVAIRSILVGLDLTAAQEERAPALVREALEMLEGRNPAGAALLSA